jgi:AAA family ATP:ADP antiporter
VQGLLAGWLLNRAGLKNTFLILPATLGAALGWMLVMPGIIGGATGRFLGRSVLIGVDRPARQTLQGLIPEERRGRVSTFMNIYLYVVGSIFGSTMLGVIILATAFGWLESSTASAAYLVLAIVATVVAIRSAWRMRTVYDESLLNWRLARRRRRGSTLIIKKLDDLPGGKHEPKRDINSDNDP